MYTVYVIRSKTTGKIYVGQTEDFEKRLNRHNDRDFDKRAFTKLQGQEWYLVYKEMYSSRKEAMRREKELKSSRGRTFIRTRIFMGR